MVAVGVPGYTIAHTKRAARGVWGHMCPPGKILVFRPGGCLLKARTARAIKLPPLTSRESRDSITMAAMKTARFKSTCITLSYQLYRGCTVLMVLYNDIYIAQKCTWN